MGSRWRTSPAPRWLAAAVIVVVLAVALPGFTSPGFLTVSASLLVTDQLVLSVDMVFASIKQMSLVHAALMGIAAYLMLGLQSEQHWSFWPAFGASIVGCLVAAAVIATFVFRASGYYFAILTFVISEIIVLAFNNLTGIAGGSGGLFFFTTGTLFGLQLGSESVIFGVICVATLLMFGYVWLIRRSVRPRPSATTRRWPGRSACRLPGRSKRSSSRPRCPPGLLGHSTQRRWERYNPRCSTSSSVSPPCSWHCSAGQAIWLAR